MIGLKDALAAFPMQDVVGGEITHGKALIAEAYATANGRVNSLEFIQDSQRGSVRFDRTANNRVVIAQIHPRSAVAGRSLGSKNHRVSSTPKF